MPVDRTRRFTLPGIQDLNKDQDAALALPLQGQHLIVGGPGTGKSVVALLRARRLLAEIGERRYRFLVYNRLLDQSSKHLFGDREPLVSWTVESWFRQLWKSAFNDDVPTHEPKKGSTFREIDWRAVGSCIEDAPEDLVRLAERWPLPYLVIDEGQDMPPAFYNALASLGFETFYVVADQNQQIYPEKCSSRQDIENVLAIETSDTLELQVNYRNTQPIALLAQHFYPADPASPRPQLPRANPSATTPELWRYGTTGTPSLEEIAGRILEIGDRAPKKLIGIITPDNTVRQKFVDALTGVNSTLDNGKPPIRTFASGQKDTLDFGQGGIMVINAQCCKGLEFEIDVLADIDRHKPRISDALKKRFYVMVARARDQVILLREGTPSPVVEELLPNDQAILIRK